MLAKVVQNSYSVKEVGQITNRAIAFRRGNRQGIHVSRYVMAIAVMLIAASAQAAEPLSIKVEPDAPPKKKFIPLDSARAQVGSNHQPIIIPKEKSLPLRSDRQALQQGQMRIDRKLTQPIGPQHSLIVQPAAPASLIKSEVLDPPSTAAPAATATLEANPGALERDSEEIESNDGGGNPVLSLFGVGDTTPSSFRDAMSGRSTGMVAGVGRQVVWPVVLDAKQYLSSGYGMRADPFNGRPTFHGGIDIAAPAGTPVVATSDAVVMEVEQDRNYGKYITLQHGNGMLSRYGHLSMQSVAPGQRVRAGAIIGAVGMTGRATGAHLDYRVSKNGMKFDPLSVLSLPSTVAMHVGSPAALAVAVHNGPRVVTPAMHPLARSPMVIQVR